LPEEHASHQVQRASDAQVQMEDAASGFHDNGGVTLAIFVVLGQLAFSAEVSHVCHPSHHSIHAS
jgi:hypothetical protein